MKQEMSMDTNQYAYTQEELASELMELTRNQLMLSFRFLAPAVAHLNLESSEDTYFCCDGRVIRYAPAAVLSFYKNERTSLNRVYLHALFHCMLQHMYGKTKASGVYWDLACDIAVEHMIINLKKPFLNSYRDGSERAILEKLQEEIPVITAELVYHHLQKNPPSERDLEAMRSVFTIDEHMEWGRTQKADDLDQDAQEKRDLDQEQERENWDKISRRALIELENFLQDTLEETEPLVQNLKALVRNKTDYRRFLKKFFSFGEEMQLSQEEFDYIFYSFGQNLYEHTKALYKGKTPASERKLCLIEPLEYRQEHRIREFAIIIDTSASVKGDKVQAFLQKTYDILMEDDAFFSKMNLHLIQCDSQVREDIKITDRRQMEEYLSHFTIQGLGNTDFRPALSYVQELCEAGEWNPQDFKGVLYFTDGEGIYPKKKPEFETAFVFLDNYLEEPPVPPWAFSIVLGDEWLGDKIYE